MKMKRLSTHQLGVLQALAIMPLTRPNLMIVASLQKRNLAVKRDGKYHITELGKQLVTGAK